MMTTSHRVSDGVGAAASGKFLLFALGAELYAVDIMRVREIIGLVPITPLPRAPAHVRGVMNLRGRIIPVIDLRAKFRLPGVEATKDTCIMVMDGVSADGEASPIGVVVDGAREVQEIPRGGIEPAPALGGAVPMECIQGIAQVKGRVVIVLDMARALSVDDGDAVSAAA